MMRLICFVLLFVSSLPVLADNRTLLILGDSLSASYGMSLEKGWVSLLQQRLADENYNYTVVNASISGETTMGAKVRLDSLLESKKPDLTIIELGGNDGLRGLSLEETRSNLSTIIEKLKMSGSEMLLIPMQLPPNYGPVYTGGFAKIFHDLAAKYEIHLGEFILDEVALNTGLMQDDGIHPKAEAQVMMLDNVWPSLQPLLNK